MNFFPKRVCFLTIYFFTGLLCSLASAKECYLDREPFVNPRIIQELTTSMADLGDQVISINLLDTQDSSRFFGNSEMEYTEYKHATVCADYGSEDVGFFCYTYIGALANDVHVVHTVYKPGWTTKFCDLLFVSLEKKNSFVLNENEAVLEKSKEMHLINRLGSMIIDEKFTPSEIIVHKNKIVIGRGAGVSAKTQQVIKVNFEND